MHPAKILAPRRRTVLALALALGLGLPSPAQAYLLDFTVSSINPQVFKSYAGDDPSGSPPVGDNLNPGFAAGFASAPAGVMAPSGNVLNRIASFSSNLMLLGGGLIGLVGLRYRRKRGW
jgi:hypothetical protein